ncbi:MAG: thiol oxidoreductase [Acidobacteria bacterium]|nr:thiol oxidoreductase [Acidobacteriota bacterium]
MNWPQTAMLPVLLALQSASYVPKDPGVRKDPSNAGGMFTGMTSPERELFRQGLEVFQTINSVQGDRFYEGTEGGLGPFFSHERCSGCHAYPAAGGSSPERNTQIAAANKAGARNRIPGFLRPDSPTLQARIRRHPNGTRDGRVYPLFSISGRKDAGGCDLAQFEVDAQFRRGNLSFRIPAPLFGIGLIEAIPETEILANGAKNVKEKGALGIAGVVHRSTSGTIQRFGWKAQVQSLEWFVAEAYVTEQGVTNELFPEELFDPPAGCLLNPVPEDRRSAFARRPADGHSNVGRLAQFLRFLAPPSPAPETPPVARGRKLFSSTGCSYCHTPSLRAGQSSYAALSEREAPLYSDLLLHHMGSQLADDIQQGAASSDMFRTAPLWGLGHRIFLLHDGRTRDLVDAIEQHADFPRSNPRGRNTSRPSEANGVVKRFRALSSEEKQNLLVFLRSL